MRDWSISHRCAGRSVAVVPTMGALHRGHLELIEVAARRADRVVVTIFVNPLQFNQPIDFDRYPRPIDDDLATCDRAGVAAVYAPTAAVMYPPGHQTRVAPGELAERLEGPRRPGHFEGVTTVVTKLFGATCPDVAVFGEKDFQQLAIIRRMTADLDLGVEIVAVPTVREPDGLALSSRNARLSPGDRAAAVVLSRALSAAAESAAAGETDTGRLRQLADEIIAAEPAAEPEYLEVVAPDTLDRVTTIGRDGAVMLTAAWFGGVRLIDNRRLA